MSRKELTTDQDIAAVDEETFLSTGNESTAQVQSKFRFFASVIKSRISE